MQFIGHSLPVHHFFYGTVRIFTLSHIVSQAVFHRNTCTNIPGICCNWVQQAADGVSKCRTGSTEIRQVTERSRSPCKRKDRVATNEEMGAQRSGKLPRELETLENEKTK